VLCPSRRKTRSFRWPTSRYDRVQFDYCNWKPNADRAGLPTLTREPVGPSPSPLPARTGKHHAQPPHVQELHGIKNPASASWPAGGGSDRIGCVLPLLARPAVGWGCRRGDVAQAGTLLRRVFYSRKALDILASPTPFRSLRLQREGPAPFRAHPHPAGRFGIQLRFRFLSLRPGEPPRATCVPLPFLRFDAHLLASHGSA